MVPGRQEKVVIALIVIVIVIVIEVLPIKNLANTAVAHSELPADDAGPHPGGRHLDDLEADVVRERPAVDEDSPQLIDPPLS